MTDGKKRRAAELAALLSCDLSPACRERGLQCLVLRRAERADHVPVGEMASEFAGNTGWITGFGLIYIGRIR